MKENGFILPLVGLALLIGIITTSVIFLPRKFKTEDQFPTKPSPTASPTFSPQLTCRLQPDRKSTGDIYVYEEFGFSIKPPVNWNISVWCPTKNLSSMVIGPPERGKEIVGNPQSIPYHYFNRKFEINIRHEDKLATIEDLKEEIQKNENRATITETKISNVPALKTTGISWGGLVDVWVPHKNKVYIISHTESVEFEAVKNPKYTQDFEQFLSSFKLL